MAVCMNDIRNFLINSKYLEIPSDEFNHNNNNDWVQYFNNRCEYYKSFQFMKRTSYKSKSNPGRYTQSGCHAELIIRGNKLCNGIHFEDSLYTNIGENSFNKLIKDFKEELNRKSIVYKQNSNGKNGIQFEIEVLENVDINCVKDIQKVNESITQLFNCLETILL